MAEVYNPLYFSLIKSLYDNNEVDNQFVARVTETGHMFQISAQGFQEITGISWADWQAQHDTTTKATTTKATTTEAATTKAATTKAATTKAATTKATTTESKTTGETATEVTSKVPDSDHVIQQNRIYNKSTLLI